MTDAFALTQMPSIATLRILADGLSQAPSVQTIGAAWQRTLRRTETGPSQPQKILKQLRRASANTELSASASKDLNTYLVVADLDFSLRTSVNTLRALLSSHGHMGFAELIANPDCREAHGKLIEATKAFQKLTDRRVQLTKRARDFIKEVASCDGPELAATLVIALTREIMGPDEVFIQRGDQVILRRPWAKKHAKDDSRGLLFRLVYFGDLLADCRWHPELQALGLDGSTPVQYDANIAIPAEWNEWPPEHKAQKRKASKESTSERPKNSEKNDNTVPGDDTSLSIATEGKPESRYTIEETTDSSIEELIGSAAESNAPEPSAPETTPNAASEQVRPPEEESN